MAIKHFYIDLSMLGPRVTGVSVYAISLAKLLEEEFQCKVVAPGYLSSHFTNPVISEDPVTIRHIPICRQPWAGTWAKLGPDPDTLIYAPHMKGLHFRSNQIITVHDLIHHYHPTRNFIENGYNNYLLPGLIRRLRGLFTISETVKNDLCQFYDIDPGKVHVVPNGIDLSRWRPGTASQNSREPYLLVVSANRPYKNTTELLDQHALWSADYRLKIVSSKARYGRTIRERVNALGLQSRVDFHDDVSEEELIELYQHCAALVYPSLMEGFGRPALEGMAAGRPVVLSDIPVHMESFSEAAIFITSGKTNTWEAAFTTLKDPHAVQEHIRKGLQVAERYTWEKCGTRLVNALLSVEPELIHLRKK